MTTRDEAQQMHDSATETQRWQNWKTIQKKLREQRDEEASRNANVEDPDSLRRTREKGIAY